MKNRLAEGVGVQSIGGYTYSGTFVHGKKTGHFDVEGPNGYTYSGDFKDDEMEGQGSAHFGDGSSFEGNWHDGDRVSGTYTYPNGNIYKGDYRDGQPNGQGEFRFNDGESYTGHVENNQYSGKGTYKWPAGDRLETTWQFGRGIIRQETRIEGF
jgi:hypothetical protein